MKKYFKMKGYHLYLIPTDKFKNITISLKLQNNLDKETVLKAAKKKGNELKDKANELVELAKEKGTPVLEGIADDLKKKTISVAQEVIDKLEEK